MLEQIFVRKKWRIASDTNVELPCEPVLLLVAPSLPSKLVVGTLAEKAFVLCIVADGDG